MRSARVATGVVDQVLPEIGLAALTVLDRIGCSAEFPPDQTCCGQPFYNAGHRVEAARIARATVKILEPFDAVVVPSGSCAAMIRVHYADLFPAGDPNHEAAGRVAAKTYEFSEFVSQQPRAADLKAACPARVTIHDGCHSLRELGVREQPRRLLSKVEGCEVVELDDRQQCCGFGGSFSVSFDRISADMGNAKVDAIASTGAEAVVSCDPSCLLQIKGILDRRGLEVEILHLAQVLASDRIGR
ncbi:MAG: (Fe-S)-binding protein [Gemmatimonadales bacterium]